ncbi:Uncharacterised protein [Legionella pneumophila]|nr:Uncharacterised protein [Legionella pneumophila]CZG57861.1 Uncharacterised protein [Legionella pneumophila]CZG61867.1 Uncharacterised protein [Legionella pneumophila]CZG61926.1 Uncharacterised protein [Legionella pneumophila]CZG63712.1 Uncharacterised protein [Legionella pneumophila]
MLNMGILNITPETVRATNSIAEELVDLTILHSQNLF